VLEATFDPLSLCTIITPLLQKLAADVAYAPYLPLLQRALLSRLLNQLSQVYSTIKIASLTQLVAPLREAGTTLGAAAAADVSEEGQIEAYVMGCARRGELNVRVDHVVGSITFIDEPFISHEDIPLAATTTTPSSSSSFSTTLLESTVQPSTAEFVRTRLGTVATCLHQALDTLDTPSHRVRRGGGGVPDNDECFAALVAAAHAERKALQLRRALVARRRELLSELSARKEREEASRRLEASRREKEEEEKRLREDARRKEIERAKKDIETIRVQEAQKLLEKMKGTFKGHLDVMGFRFFFF
jgi:translation initiation factor 3 subunit A